MSASALTADVALREVAELAAVLQREELLAQLSLARQVLGGVPPAGRERVQNIDGSPKVSYLISFLLVI